MRIQKVNIKTLYCLNEIFCCVEHAAIIGPLVDFLWCYGGELLE